MRFTSLIAVLLFLTAPAAAEDAPDLFRPARVELQGPGRPPLGLIAECYLDQDSGWDFMGASDDGSRVALATRGGVVRLRDVHSKENRFTLLEDASAFRGISLNSEGTRLAWGFETGQVAWCGIDGCDLKRWQGHASGVAGIAFLPDGRLSTIGEAGDLAVWLGPSKVLYRTEARVPIVSSFGISGDGSRVAAGFQDGSVRVLKSEDGSEVQEFSGFRSPVTQTGLSGDGVMVAALSATGEAAIWDLSNQTCLLALPETSAISNGLFGWIPQDGALVLPLVGETKIIWPVQGAWSRFRTGWGRSSPTVFRIAGNPAKFLLAGPGIRPRAEAIQEASERSRGPDPDLAVIAMGFSPDGKEIATQSQNGTFRMLNLTTGRTRSVAGVYVYGTSAPVFTPDGNRVFGVPKPKTAVTWERELLETPTARRGGSERPVLIADNGTRAAYLEYGLDETSLLVVKPGAGNEGITIPTLRSHSIAVAFSPDGKRLAVAQGKVLRIWNAETGADEAGPMPEVDTFFRTTIQWLPDGSGVQLVDRQSGMVKPQCVELRGLRAPRLVVSDPRENAIAWSPDARLYVVASNRTVDLHEAWTGKFVTSLKMEMGTSRKPLACFSPDGAMLVSNSGFTGLEAWRLEGATASGARTDVDQCWNDLQSHDAAIAWKALEQLRLAPASVDDLSARVLDFGDLRVPLSQAQLAALERAIHGMTREDPEIQEIGMGELATMNDRFEVNIASRRPAATPRLRTVLEKHLDGLSSGLVSWNPILRRLRANAALERMGTREACDVLAKVAAQSPSPRVQADAAASVKRLDSRLRK
ncbi:MAG: WD40 repeat domain-containing protein [Planctomycetota bacterium]